MLRTLSDLGGGVNMTEIAGRVEFLHEFGVDDVVREGSRRFDALETPELGEKVERTLHTLLSRVS